MLCKRAIVKGRVQGVSYRASTQRQAELIGGLKGFVRNLDNGDVEILVQGDSEKVKALLEWARRGPPRARVDELKISDEVCNEELAPFQISY